jgi:hypothetical protein
MCTYLVLRILRDAFQGYRPETDLAQEDRV